MSMACHMNFHDFLQDNCHADNEKPPSADLQSRKPSREKAKPKKKDFKSVRESLDIFLYILFKCHFSHL